MTQAIWNGAVLAESDDVVVVDGFTYFPRESVEQDLLVESAHTSVCGWKGRANYYTVVVDGAENRDAGWYYPAPSEAAQKVEGRIAFWRGVKVVTDVAAAPASIAGGGHQQHDVPAEQANTGVVDLDDASFEAGSKGAWTVVDFWAPWCQPCKAFHPVFDQAERDTPGLRFARLNVEDNPLSSTAMDILSIPTVVLFDPDGNEVHRLIGVPPREDFNRLLARATSQEEPAA